MAAFATVEELQQRLDWMLSEAEQGVAEGALEDLSIEARHHGSPEWSEITAPEMARSLVLRAAARFMRNPDGYVQSRAGDETLAWDSQGERAGSPFFTDGEIKTLASIAGKESQSVYSVELTAWRTQPRKRTGYVPTTSEGYGVTPKPFPFYADDAGSI